MQGSPNHGCVATYILIGSGLRGTEDKALGRTGTTAHSSGGNKIHSLVRRREFAKEHVWLASAVSRYSIPDFVCLTLASAASVVGAVRAPARSVTDALDRFKPLLDNYLPLFFHIA